MTDLTGLFIGLGIGFAGYQIGAAIMRAAIIWSETSRKG